MFYQADIGESSKSCSQSQATIQVSTNQEAANVPKGMVLEKKTLNLLALLMAHTEGNSLTVTVVPRPSTLAPPLPSPFEATKKKRKREKHSRKEGFKEGGNIANLPTRTL